MKKREVMEPMPTLGYWLRVLLSAVLIGVALGCLAIAAGGPP